MKLCIDSPHFSSNYLFWGTTGISHVKKYDLADTFFEIFLMSFGVAFGNKVCRFKKMMGY
jgi:hypothetical protein